MQDFFVALALVLVIEGLIWAVAPSQMKQMVLRMVQQDDRTMRIGGLASAIVGLVAVWLIRG